MRIFVSNGSGASSEIFGISADWNENSITWTSRATLATEKVAASQTSPEGTWVEYDVSSLVTGDGTVNLGLFNTHSDGIGFSSRQGSNPPQLIVVPGNQIVPAVPTVSPSTGKLTVAVAGPADGTTLSDPQDVKLTVSVSGSGTISKVELYDNDALVATEDAAPFTYTWAITSKANGDHAWTAVAYDNLGGSTTSVPLKLTVDIAGTPTASSGSVTAAGETAPVPHSGDAADDPAIWVHPTDPSLSTIIGTDKLGGLAVYDLGGKQLFYYADSSPNNVDVRYKFPLAGSPPTLWLRAPPATTRSAFIASIQVHADWSTSPPETFRPGLAWPVSRSKQCQFRQVLRLHRRQQRHDPAMGVVRQRRRQNRRQARSARSPSLR